MNKKKIFVNTLYNILGSILPIVFLQLIVYPILSRKLDISTYGKVIALIGFCMLVIQVSGIGINNARIIMAKEYEDNKMEGDFNLLSIYIMIINVFITVLILILVNDRFFSWNNLLALLYIELGFLNLYLSSEFNISLKFNKILKGNIFLIIGYLIGLLLFFLFNLWSLIFFMGMSFIVMFDLKNTDYWKSGFQKTPLFKESLKKVLVISFSSLMISVVTYADRLFLYPLLGSSMVAIYYTASQFGKLISMGLGPISSVILSFFSKKNQMSLKHFWQFNSINFSFCIIFYLISLFLAKPVIGILYPTLSNEIVDYMNIANLAAILTGSSSLVQPIILKFCPVKWQMYIQITHIICYFSLGIVFTNSWGLLGFCYANVIAALFRLILLCVVGTITLSKLQSRIQPERELQDEKIS